MFGIGGVINLGIAVRLHDHFSNQARVIMGAYSNLMNQTASQTRRNFQYVYEAQRDFGYAASAVGVAMTYGFKKATESAAEFQDKLITIKAILGKDVSAAGMKSLSGLATSLSKELPFSSIELADSMKELVKAGITAKEIPDVLRAIGVAAVAADEKMGGRGGMADMMVDMMNAWNINSKDAMAFTDVFTKTANLSTIDASDIYAAMKYAQSSFMGMHIPLNDALALIGSMGSAGLKGTLGGTSISNTLRFLAKGLAMPTPKQSKALNAIGLSRADLEDSKTGVIDLVKTIELLTEKTKGIKPADMTALMQSLFGERGSRIQPLIEKLKEASNNMGMTVREFKTQLDLNSKGEGERVFRERMESYTNKQKLFQNSITNLKIAMGNALLPMLTKLADIATPLFNHLATFAGTGIGKVVTSIVAVAGAVTLLVGAFNLLTASLGFFAIRYSAAQAATSFAGMALPGSGRFAWSKSIAAVLSMFRGGSAGASTASTLSMGTKLSHLWQVISGNMSLNKNGKLVRTIAVPGKSMVVAEADALGTGFSKLLGWVSKLGRPLLSMIKWFSVIGTISSVLSVFGVSLYAQIKLFVGAIVYAVRTIFNTINHILNPAMWFSGPTWAQDQDRIYRQSMGWGVRQGQRDNMENLHIEKSVDDNAFLKRTFKGAAGNSNQQKRLDNLLGKTAVINIIQDGKVALTKEIDLNNDQTIYAKGLV